MKPSVTPTGFCAACSRPLLGKRRDALTCGSACRQRFYRKRGARAAHAQLRAGDLTPEIRTWLKHEVAHRRLEQLERQRDLDRQLFADEWMAA